MTTATAHASTDVLSPLRAIYRAARAGAPIDPQTFVATVASCVCDGADVGPALRAFEPFAFIAIRHLGGPDGAYLCRAALAKGGYHAAIRMASLLGWTDVWSAAMSAHYGPTGTHPSRVGTDGRPTAETLAECPSVGRCMQAGCWWAGTSGTSARPDGTATSWR